MSRATFVPETYTLSGDDAKQVLERTGRGRLARSSIKRFAAADGGSHSRALAHAGVLTFFPAVIAVVGLAGTFHLTRLRDVLDQTVAGLAPGPSGRILTEALHQGSRTSGTTALIGGIAAALVSGTTAMAQIQRGADRIYGMQSDRPLLRRYALAFLLNLTAGLTLLAAFVLLAAGAALGDAGRSLGWSDGVATAFAIARWPVGILLATVAITVILKVAPNRHQPKGTWLVSGTAVAVVLWLAFTAALGLYFNLDDQLGQTYGPLLGIIGLLLWSYLTGIAMYLGFAFAAELEAVRAGTPQSGAPPAVTPPTVTLPEAEPRSASRA
jgi:YihY family inner membrane protein